MEYHYGEPAVEPCPNCGSTNTYFNSEDYWECRKCHAQYREKEYVEAIKVLLNASEDYLKSLNDGTATAKTVNISGLDFEV
jgi:ribosomal protein L37AE/L43A